MKCRYSSVNGKLSQYYKTKIRTILHDRFKFYGPESSKLPLLLQTVLSVLKMWNKIILYTSQLTVNTWRRDNLRQN